ncbi:MAG: endonuclease/exonuclease/phosphatase family protein [Clostridia bacterium]|nr:endonuclease/exonuclease/phosphatase family protein [Clostridia bacterium]
MRIMTSNIWGDYFGNPVDVRIDQILSMYRKYSPDILGLQEITPGWYGSGLFEALSDEYIPVGTERTGNSNYVPFLYKKHLKLLAKGYEYLTNTPDASKAITWAVLRDGEQLFAVCNTHFWWKSGPEHDNIRVENAVQLASLMQEIYRRWHCPVFAFGDMNTLVTSGVFTVYAGNHIRHLWDLAEAKTDIGSHHGDPVKGEDGRYHGKTTDKPHTGSIDHIVALGDGFTVAGYTVVEDQDALDATDHSPVYADVRLI